MWQKPGTHKAAAPEHFVSHHPGADDTDSEDEQERIKEELKEENPAESVSGSEKDSAEETEDT